MKRKLEYAEGQEAWIRFIGAARHILGVSREEILRRESDYKIKAALNPRKRGPKPKQSSVSPVLCDQPPA